MPEKRSLSTNVSTSRSAWKKAEGIADAKERTAFIAKVLPSDPKPIAGNVVFDAKDPVLVLSNRSKSPVVVNREPTCIDYTRSFGMSSKYGKQPENRDDFVELAPGATMRFKLDPKWAQKAALQRLTVSYLRNGNEFGVNAWIGVVELKFEAK